jgi:hypothetical protein
MSWLIFLTKVLLSLALAWSAALLGEKGTSGVESQGAFEIVVIDDSQLCYDAYMYRQNLLYIEVGPTGELSDINGHRCSVDQLAHAVTAYSAKDRFFLRIRLKDQEQTSIRPLVSILQSVCRAANPRMQCTVLLHIDFSKPPLRGSVVRWLWEGIIRNRTVTKPQARIDGKKPEKGLDLKSPQQNQHRGGTHVRPCQRP